MPSDLAAATSLQGFELEQPGVGCWSAQLDDAWQGEFGFFGGYLAAILVRGLASVGAPAGRTPLSASMTFLEPPTAGPAEVVTRVDRTGRVVTFASVQLQQNGKVVAVARGALCRPGGSGPAFVDIVAPEVSPPADSPMWHPHVWATLPIVNRFELRSALTGAPFSGMGVVETAGWFRLLDPVPLDASLLAFAADAFVPPIMMRETRPLTAPTMELHLTFRQSPSTTLPGDGWLLIELRSEFATGGFMEQSGAVWSEAGELLARVRHLNVIRYHDQDVRPRKS
jgi:acyl-CoA thioesterase